MHHKYFSLIHADFNKYLVSSLGNYFTDTILTDVTLVSDEQIPFKAHRFILSASSPVMKDLLLSNPHSHPLIYLRGVKQQELVHILQFIYFGEANVHNKQIKKFLDIAKDFKLSVLTKSSSEIRIMPSTTECDTPTENDGICNLCPNNEVPENTLEVNLLEEILYISRRNIN